MEEDRKYVSREGFEYHWPDPLFPKLDSKMLREMEDEGITFYLNENGIPQIDASGWIGNQDADS